MLQWLSTLFGPVFAKEMVEMARRKRYFFTRVLYVGVLLVIFFVVWQENQWYLRRHGPIDGLPRIAGEMFTSIGTIQYFAVYFFVPLFLMAVIAGERESRTLELLLVTDLLDREIVLGKLGSRLGMLLVLILSALPLFSLIGLFGGIDYQKLWWLTLATLQAMLVAGAVSIYCSVTSKSPLGAIIQTYGWLAIWFILLPFGAGLVCELLDIGRNDEGAIIFYCQAFINPVSQMLVSVDSGWNNMLTAWFGPSFLPWTFIGPTVFSLWLIYFAIRRLRQPESVLVRKGSLRAKILQLRETFRNRQARYRHLRAPSVFGMKVENPLWLRSRLSLAYDRDGYISAIQTLEWFVAVCILVMLVFFEPHGLNYEDLAVTSLSVLWLGAGLLLLAVAASSFASDRRRGILDLVLATPLSAREILDGTFLAVFEHVRKALLLPIVLAGLFVLTGATPVLGAFVSLGTACLYGAALVSMGLMCSLPARTAPSALVLAFVFPAVSCIGTFFLVLWLEEIHGPVLWVVSLLALIGTWAWTSRKKTSASVGCHFISMYLVLSCLATFWTYSFRDEYPVASFLPPYLTIAPLEKWLRYGSGSNWPSWYRGPGEWWMGVGACWASLICLLIWSRWWMIRHFDELTGRSDSV